MILNQNSPSTLLDSEQRERAIAITNEEFLPVFEEMAEVFGVDIEIKYGRDTINEIVREKNEKRKIYFYVDTFPVGLYKTVSVNLSSVFGFCPKEPIRVHFSSSTPGMTQFGAHAVGISTPESPGSNFLGCIFGNHIFVYPNILTLDSWARGDRAKALYAICYWSLPIAISKTVVGPPGVLALRGLDTLRLAYRGQCLPEDTIESFTERFGVFVKNLNGKMVEDLTRKIDKSRVAIEENSREYFSHLATASVHRRLIGIVTEELSTRDLEQEFGLLLEMESVETVRVKNDRYLVIKTSPIFQVPDSDNEDRTAVQYDIGEFTIQIDTLHMPLLTHAAIRIFQNGYLGTHGHIHVTGSDQTICFGSSIDIGLNAPIDNLMSKFNIVSLVNLILTFLKKEGSIPMRRDAQSLAKSTDPERDEYRNSEEREEEKRAFVRLTYDTMIHSSTVSLKNSLAGVNQKLQIFHNALLTEKIQLHGYEELLNKISVSLDDFQDMNQKALRLIRDPSIFGLFLSGEELVIYFNWPRAVETKSPSVFQDYILKITTDSWPILLVSSTTKLFRAIPLVSSKDSSNSEDEMMFAHLQSGQIFKILESVRTRIINQDFDPQAESSKPKKEEQ